MDKRLDGTGFDQANKKMIFADIPENDPIEALYMSPGRSKDDYSINTIFRKVQVGKTYTSDESILSEDKEPSVKYLFKFLPMEKQKATNTNVRPLKVAAYGKCYCNTNDNTIIASRCKILDIMDLTKMDISPTTAMYALIKLDLSDEDRIALTKVMISDEKSVYHYINRTGFSWEM